MIEDAMEYNVDLVNADSLDKTNKIKLTVKRKPRKTQVLAFVARYASSWECLPSFMILQLVLLISVIFKKKMSAL